MIDININSIEKEFYSEYQQENMTSRVDRNNNYHKLLRKLPQREANLLSAIDEHLSALRQPSDNLINEFYVNKKHAKEVLKSNTLDITPNFIYYYQVIKLEDYSSKKNANYKARSLCKTLVREKVLYKLNSKESKDRYLVNPLYIYYSPNVTSDNFGTVYLQWLDCNGLRLSPEDKYLKSVYKKRSKTTGKVSVISNPIELNTRITNTTQALKEVKEEVEERHRPPTVEEREKQLLDRERAHLTGKEPQGWINAYLSYKISLELLPDHIKPLVDILSPTKAHVLDW